MALKQVKSVRFAHPSNFFEERSRQKRNEETTKVKEKHFQHRNFQISAPHGRARIVLCPSGTSRTPNERVRKPVPSRRLGPRELKTAKDDRLANGKYQKARRKNEAENNIKKTIMVPKMTMPRNDMHG